VEIKRGGYPLYNYRGVVTFTHAGHEFVEPELVYRIAALCHIKNKKVTCTRGMVTSYEQKAIADKLLLANPTWYKSASGAIYNGLKCMVAAPGNSMHEYGQAMDIGDKWFEALTNGELELYGLCKPMNYEPWHVQIIETKMAAFATIKKEYKKMAQIKDYDKISDWAKPAVVKTMQIGFMAGDDKGNFNPQDPITREQMAAILSKLYDAFLK